VALGIVTLVHKHIHPNLMVSPVHSVPWFQKFDVENQHSLVNMLYPPDLNTTFACRSPSWEGKFSGIKMHNGPFAVLTAKKVAEQAIRMRVTEDLSPQSESHRPDANNPIPFV
jgi:hypothetical protein